jgi:plasmid stabilization system protein ParE
MKQPGLPSERPPYVSIITEHAKKQIRKAREWRRKFIGEAAVDELDDEIAEALDLLEKFPEAGSPRPTRTPGRYSKTRRRWPLDRSGFRIYYRVHAAHKVIVIAEIRHHARRPRRAL